MLRIAALDSMGASRGDSEVLMGEGPNHPCRRLPIVKRESGRFLVAKLQGEFDRPLPFAAFVL
jgi:hypothetical protein